MSETRRELADTTGSIEQPISSEALSTDHDERKPRVGSLFSNTAERLQNFKRRVWVAVAIAIVSAEVSPLNEVMRFGAAGATQAATGNALLAAAAFGMSTLLIEGLAAESTGYLMGTQQGKKVFTRLHNKTRRALKGRKMSWPIEASLAYFGGSAIVMSAKQIDNPNRSKEAIKRHGRLTAAWLAGVSTIQWGLTANSIDSPTVENIAAAVAVTVGAAVGVKIAQKRSRS